MRSITVVHAITEEELKVLSTKYDSVESLKHLLKMAGDMAIINECKLIKESIPFVEQPGVEE